MNHMNIKIITIAMLLPLMAACGNNGSKDNAEAEADSVVCLHDTIALSSKPLPSAGDVEYDITLLDTLTDGQLDYYDDEYAEAPGVLTFRGNLMRQADYGGRVKGTPTTVEEVWNFTTEIDMTKTKVGAFGGGTGWTGQSVYVEWPDSVLQAIRQQNKMLTEDFGKREVIVSSLCGKMYFLNYDSGKPSRQPVAIGNPVKGSASLDPTLNGNLYVGHGVPVSPPMGQCAFDMMTNNRFFFSGDDIKAWRRWNAFDSSPVRVGGFLFWLGENGTVYKFKVNGRGDIKLHSTMRYKLKGDWAAGMENSICVYKNYGYFGDNHGDILCIDLNTLKPIWHYDNHDDIDGTIVCEVTDGTPYVYCGCEVDRQGDEGISHFVKLNGLNGTVVWEQQLPCRKLNIGEKHYDGGFYCTPLLGKGDCKNLIFANVCQPGNSRKADFIAFDRNTGSIVYRVPLMNFAWSSPVAFYNEKNKMFVFTGDSCGNGYLIEASTGKILFQKNLIMNFESSPTVVGSDFIVGSRGNKIHRFTVK